MVRSGPALAAIMLLFPSLTLAATIGTVQPLRSPAGPGSGEPRLTVGPGESLAMSWLESRASGGHRLRWALWRGRRWSTPATIAEGDSFFVNWADFPSLRWLGGQRWVAHWLWQTGADTYAYEVRLRFSNDGGKTWQRPIVPHRDDTATEHGFVTLLPEGGSVRAFWLDGRRFVGHGEHEHAGADMTLRTALVDENGTLRDEVELDGRTCDCCATAAVGTPDGVLVAYRDRSGDEIRDIALVRNEDKRWNPPTPMHADEWKIAGCPVNGPAIDAAGARVTLAWFTSAADTPRVLVAQSSDGGRRFTSPMRIDAGSPLGRVGVASLRDGHSFVTWLESGQDGARICGRMIDPAGIPSGSVTIARSTAARASGFPQVARVGAHLYFAWTEAGRPSRVKLARASVTEGDSRRK